MKQAIPWRAMFVMGSVVFAAANLAAQRRLPLVGRAVLETGKPAAFAEVTLVAGHPAESAMAAQDVVTVKASASGRFRGDVLPGRGYSGWASMPSPTQPELRLVSAAQAGLAPGRPVTFALVQAARR